MARKMKGGENDFLSTMVASGVGAYAAKQSTSIGGLLWTLFKYGLVVVLILVGVSLLAWMFRASKETFVPVTPSPEQDRKVMTPAGNVITY
jgi:hypothetical protein